MQNSEKPGGAAKPIAVAVKVTILRIIVFVVMAAVAAAAGFTPRFLGAYLIRMHDIGDGVLALRLSFYVWACMIPLLAALWRVKRLCDVIARGDPFSAGSLRELSHIVYCCYAEAAINVVCFVVFQTAFAYSLVIVCLIITAVCGAIAIFATVLKELVKAAIKIKEDNELTI